MIKWSKFGVVLGLLGLCDPATALLHAQVVERDTKITGPRGRSINRQVDIERGPGTFQRQVQIQRPGGTLERSTTIQRGWGGFPGGGFGGFRPLPFFPGPRPVTSWGLGITAAPIITIPFFGGGVGVLLLDRAWVDQGWGWRQEEESLGRGASLARHRGRPRSRIRSTRWHWPRRSFRATMPPAGATERENWAS